MIPDEFGRTPVTRALTNEALSDRLRKLRIDIRRFGKDERAALLSEAAWRLIHR